MFVLCLLFVAACCLTVAVVCWCVLIGCGVLDIRGSLIAVCCWLLSPAVSYWLLLFNIDCCRLLFVGCCNLSGVC